MVYIFLVGTQTTDEESHASHKVTEALLGMQKQGGIHEYKERGYSYKFVESLTSSGFGCKIHTINLLTSLSKGPTQSLVIIFLLKDFLPSIAVG